MDNQVTELDTLLRDMPAFTDLSDDLQKALRNIYALVEEKQEVSDFYRDVFLEEMEPLSSEDRITVMRTMLELSDAVEDSPNTMNTFFISYGAGCIDSWVSDEFADSYGSEENTSKPFYLEEFSAVIAEREPREILEQWAKTEGLSQDVIKNAALQDPFYYSNNYEYNFAEYVDFHPTEIPDDAFLKVLDQTDPYHLQVDLLIEMFGDRDMMEDIFRRKWEDDGVDWRNVVDNHEFFADKPYGKEFFIEAAKSFPAGVATSADQLKGISYSDDIFKAILQEDPLLAMSNRSLSAVVADKPYVQGFIDQAIEKNPINVARFAILNSENPLAEKAYNDSVARFEEFLAENPDNSWRLVRIINDLHEEPASVRFDTVEGFSASAMYDLVSVGRDDVYTSTFNGLFDRFVDKMGNEDIDFSDIIAQDPRRLQSLPAFLEGVASFSRVGDFLREIGDTEQVELIDTLFNEINDTDNNELFIHSTASFVQGMLAADHNIEYVEAKIIEGYQNSEGHLKDQYGVLGAWLSNTAGREISDEHEAFFDKLSENERYHLPDLSQKSTEDLLDEHGRNYQLHIFYDDEDGHMSYAHYKRFMQQDGWSIEENKEDGIALFQKDANGREVHAYVSMPHADGEAAEYIKEAAQEEGISFSVIAHRGHSYHVDGSLDQIDDKAQIVFLGSCGGYQNVENVLESSSNAHILSTSGTGSMYVNDPLLTWINKDILYKDAVDWSGIDSKLSKMKNENASFYHTPPENLALMFSKKFEELENEREAKIGLSGDFDNRAQGNVVVPIEQIMDDTPSVVPALQQ